MGSHMKIVQFTAENVKKLKVVQITPKGDVVQITGRNGSGKSSVLDSIWFALGGTDDIPAQPIRKGEQTARITLDLGSIKITRKFTEKGSSLVVENEEGARFSSPQKMLDDLIGALSFDPLAFANMKPTQQYSEIKRVSNISIDIDALDAQSKTDYESRTEVNRQAKEARVRAESYEFSYPPMDALIDVGALTAELATVGEFNAAIDERARRRAAVADQIVSGEKRILELEAELVALKASVAANKKLIESAEPLPAKKDSSELQKQINEAQIRNAEHTKRQEQKSLFDRAVAAEAKSAELTKLMENRATIKARAIQEAKMPVSGLSLQDGVVLLNGIPFEQASSAEQLKTSVAIAMAANPKLKVIRIKDGSLLDDEGIAMISAMAADQDYQVWIERVDTSGKIGIVMEDGVVKQDNQEAA